MATTPVSSSVDVPSPSVDLPAAPHVTEFATDPVTVGRWSMHRHSRFVITDAAGRSVYKLPQDHPHVEVLRAAALALPGLVSSLEKLEDLCPRMSDDDPIAPAIADALREARAALRPIRAAQREGK